MGADRHRRTLVSFFASIVLDSVPGPLKREKKKKIQKKKKNKKRSSGKRY